MLEEIRLKSPNTWGLRQETIPLGQPLNLTTIEKVLNMLKEHYISPSSKSVILGLIDFTFSASSGIPEMA